MKDREERLRDYEESLFALMMDEVAAQEGEEALREWEELARDADFQMPQSLDQSCHQLIHTCYAKERYRQVKRGTGRVLRKMVLAAAVALLCLATALTVSGDFQRDTLHFLLRTFSAAEQEPALFLEVDWIPEGHPLIEGGGDNTSRWKSYKGLEIEVTRSKDTSYRIDPEKYEEISDIEVKGVQGSLLYRPANGYQSDRYGVLLYDTQRDITVIIIAWDMSRGEVLKIAENLHY